MGLKRPLDNVFSGSFKQTVVTSQLIYQRPQEVNHKNAFISFVELNVHSSLGDLIWVCLYCASCLSRLPPDTFHFLSPWE